MALLYLSKGVCRAKWDEFNYVQGRSQQGIFTVHLIPETLKRTTMSSKSVGNKLNLEVDYIVQSYITHRIYTGGKDGENIK